MKRQSFRRLAVFTPEDVPAFHAGFLVTLFIFASLLNLGAFAVLLTACAVLDFVQYRERKSYDLRKTVSAVIRSHLLHLALFGAVALLVVFSYPASAVHASLQALSIGAGLFFFKGLLLSGIATILLHPLSYLQEKGVDMRRKYSTMEHLSLFVIIACVLILGISPYLIIGGWQTILLLLRSQLVPWRM